LRRHHIQKSALFDKQYAPLRAQRDINRTVFDGFLFHDFQNIIASPTGFLEQAQMVVDFEKAKIEGVSPVFSEKYKRISNIGSRLREKVQDTENRRVRMDEYTTLMNELVMFSNSPEIEVVINRSDGIQKYSAMKRNIEAIPTAAFLIDSYTNIMKFFENPEMNESSLGGLEKKHISAKQLIKKFASVQIEGDDFELNGIEAVMFYTAANKFSTEFKPTGTGEETNIDIVIRRGEEGILTFEAVNEKGEIRPRFARYAKPTEERALVSAENLADGKFSQGLLATELLGYLTEKNLTYKIEGGRAQFTIEPAHYSFERRITNEIGEPAGIRRFNEKDFIDMKRMRLIDQNIGDEKRDAFAIRRDILRTSEKYAVENHRLDREYFAVTAQTDEVTGLSIQSQNKSEVEGVIVADFSDKSKEVYMQGVDSSQPTPDQNPIQLTFKQRKKSPPHLMASGVRQLCMNILRADNESEVSEDQISTISDGHIVRKQPKERILFDDFSSKRVIYAHIDPANADSIEIMNESGFTKSGEMGIYVLNWDKLHAISEKINESRIKNKLSALMQQTPLNTDVGPPNFRKD
jgi:hypothetical protein